MAPYRNIKYKNNGVGIWNSEAIDKLTHRLEYEGRSIYIFLLGTKTWGFRNAEDSVLAGQNFVSRVLGRVISSELAPFPKTFRIQKGIRPSPAALLKQYLANHNRQYRLVCGPDILPVAHLENWGEANCVISVNHGKGSAIILPSTKRTFSSADLKLLAEIAHRTLGNPESMPFYKSSDS